MQKVYKVIKYEIGKFPIVIKMGDRQTCLSTIKNSNLNKTEFTQFILK